MKVKDSSEPHEIVNVWIDLAIKQKRLLVINIDGYTNVHNNTIKGTSNQTKCVEIYMTKKEGNGILRDR